MCAVFLSLAPSRVWRGAWWLRGAARESSTVRVTLGAPIKVALLGMRAVNTLQTLCWCHPPASCPVLAFDIQKLYDKDPLGNILIDKKKLEKILLLSYVCNTQAGVCYATPPTCAPSPLLQPCLQTPTDWYLFIPEYQQGFHEMVMLFQLMVEHEHETFWLFQFFLQKTVRAKPMLYHQHPCLQTASCLKPFPPP